MITKTTGLDSKYSSLFDEIREESNGDIDVNNLEEYFMNLTDIGALNTKYLMLPLDEPMFEIDADARKITIPDEFKTNGISVEQDNLAETVFFKINRYYDYTDLNNMDIAINWKIGDVSGISKNFIKNADIAPEYLIFGWPISKDIASKSGVLSFAVQFYKKNLDGSYKYNFNTQAATIAIKAGLTLENPISLDNSSDILNMLVNSVYGEGTAAVEKAVWSTGAGKGLVLSSEDADFAASINLETTVTSGAPGDVSAALVGKASAGSGAVITYKVPDGVTSNLTAGIPASADNGLLKITVSEAGSYTATALGAKFDDDNKKIGSGEATDSYIVTVPSAKQPAVAISIDDQASVTSYEVSGENNVFLKPSAGAKLKATASAAAGMVSDDLGAFSFSWLKDGTALSSTAADFFYLDATSPVQQVTEEGVYKVSVVHYKNGTKASAVVSSEVNVAFPASSMKAADLSLVDADGTAIPASGVEFDSTGSNNSVTVKAIVDPETDYSYTDNISFIWQKAASASAADADWENVGNAIVCTAAPFEASLVINKEGYYRVVARNNYKNSSYVLKSKAFSADNISNNG